MKKLILAAIGAIALLPNASAASTYSSYTPESFQAELNRTQWDNPGNTYTFSYLNSCEVKYRKTYGPRRPMVIEALKQEYNQIDRSFDVMMEEYGSKYGTDDYAYLYFRLQDRGMNNVINKFEEKLQKLRDIAQQIEDEENDQIVLTNVEERYVCNGGYVRWSNPQGNRTCEVTYAASKDGKVWFNTKNCVWSY